MCCRANAHKYYSGTIVLGYSFRYWCYQGGVPKRVRNTSQSFRHHLAIARGHKRQYVVTPEMLLLATLSFQPQIFPLCKPRFFELNPIWQAMRGVSQPTSIPHHSFQPPAFFHPFATSIPSVERRLCTDPTLAINIRPRLLANFAQLARLSGASLARRPLHRGPGANAVASPTSTFDASKHNRISRKTQKKQ